MFGPVRKKSNLSIIERRLQLKPLIYKYLEIDDFYRIECETETQWHVR